VDRVAAELGRLAQARIRTVIIPGTHDVYDRSSVYRAYDLAALAGTRPAQEMVIVLTPERPWIHLPAIDAVVHGPVFATKRAPRSPLLDLAAVATPAATWKIGLLHAAIAIPGRTDNDEVVITTDEIAASGLDYLALGHWHSAQTGKARDVTYAYAGAPEPVAVDQDRAGKVLLVTLDQRNGRKSVTVEKRTVGRTTFERREIDAATVESQPALVTGLLGSASPDLVLDLRLIGVRRDDLDLEPTEVEEALRGSFLRVRVRDLSRPALSTGALPPAETISGAFIRNVEGRIADLEASGDEPADREADELRDVLRLGRLLLAGHEVTL
jgi:exonuclease SbcD